MSDKRVIAISAIVLVAVIMGMSAVVPAMAQPPENPPKDTSGCSETKKQFEEGNIPEDVWKDIVKTRTCPD